MSAGKVTNFLKKSSNFYGGNYFQVGKLGEILGEYGFTVGSDYDDVEDTTVLPPPEIRRRIFYVDHDAGRGQLDEEDFSHAPNIATSRWAYDDEMDDCGNRVNGSNVLKGKALKGRSSSPESGVTQKEGSDVSDGGYNNGDECLQRGLMVEDHMDVDLSDYEGSFGGGLYSAEDEEDVFRADVGESRNRDMLHGCRSVFEYEKLGKITGICYCYSYMFAKLFFPPICAANYSG